MHFDEVDLVRADLCQVAHDWSRPDHWKKNERDELLQCPFDEVRVHVPHKACLFSSRPPCWVVASGSLRRSPQATITASSVPAEPLLPLLWAVRLSLLGADESKCTWREEPGQYRWLFSRTDKQIQPHIVWFDDSLG
jgi:hypothetical protein